MADRFLLPSSHRLSRPKSSEVCFELREKFDIDETSADTVYATRYKEWWASQFSTVPKMQIRPRAQIPRVKEIQAKPGNLSICFGLFCFISASILSCGMLSVIPAAFPLLSRVLLEFSSCKTDIDSLRQDLIALNTSVRTPSSTTIPLKPCSTEVQRTPQDEKGRYLFAELNTTRSLSQNITLRDTIGQFGFSSTVKKDVNKSRLSLEMHNTTMSCLNSSKANFSQVMHAVQETLTSWYMSHIGAGVNWLLHINGCKPKVSASDLRVAHPADFLPAVTGASVSDHSASYCPENIWLCELWSSWKWYDHLPAQLSPEIILQEGSLGAWIDPHASLGRCWAMSGTTGFVEFRLSRAVEAELLVLEHVSPQVSHDAGSSAIKDFQIWGWEIGKAGSWSKKREQLASGQYRLDIHASPLAHIQKFNLTKQKINHVRLEILSNHGNSMFTCIYKVKLFGRAI